MALSPIIAFVMAVILGLGEAYTFFAEAIGIWVFATYWLVKSRELSLTSAERLVLHDMIEI